MLYTLWRAWFPKRVTRSWDEFESFVKERECKYVTVFGQENLEQYSSDSGALVFLGAAVAIAPDGFTFTFIRETGKLYALYSPVSRERIAEERRKLLRYLKTLYESLTNAVTPQTMIDRAYEKQRLAAYT